MKRKRLSLFLAIVISSSCAGRSLPRVRIVPHCADGLPVKILLDQRCPPDGICGYTCDPDRWIIIVPKEIK